MNRASFYRRERLASHSLPRLRAPAATTAKPDKLDDAAGRLRIAQALEKTNPRASLDFYRRVVKDFPGTPEAKTAAKRIEAIQATAKK